MCVEIDGEVEVTGEGDFCVAGREGLHGILDLGGVSGANVGPVHDGLEASSLQGTVFWRDDGFADGEEMRAETADRLLDDDLEESAGDEGKGEAEDGGRGIVEAADTGMDLTKEDDGDGKEGAHDTGGSRREDRRLRRVGEVGIDNVAGSGEGDRKEAVSGGMNCPELERRVQQILARQLFLRSGCYG